MADGKLPSGIKSVNKPTKIQSTDSANSSNSNDTKPKDITVSSFSSGNIVRHLFDNHDLENWASNDNGTITGIRPLPDPSIPNSDYYEYSKANLKPEKKIIKNSTSVS